MTMPPGYEQEDGGNEEIGSIEGSKEVAPSGFVILGEGGMGGFIGLDATSGLSRPMPTGHELGFEDPKSLSRERMMVCPKGKTCPYLGHRGCVCALWS